MTKRHLAYLLASTLLAAPAFGQTGSSQGTSAPSSPRATDTERSGASPDMSGSANQNRVTSGQAPSPSAPGASTSGSSPAMTTSTSQQTGARSSVAGSEVNKALAAPGPNQMLASDIRGTRVYGANNENVGDINDILLAQDGDIVALVVGVGGFLGIGQKDVAIPYAAFDFVTDGQRVAGRTTTTATSTKPNPDPARAPSSSVTRTGPDAGTRSGPASTASGQSTDAASSPNRQSGSPGDIPSASGISGTTNAPATADNPRGSGAAPNATDPATTGATSTRTTTTSTTSTQQSAGLLKPERIVLRGMTKADLEAAPEFKRNAAAVGSSAPARSGTAPNR
jgi:hypothetical protein